MYYDIFVVDLLVVVEQGEHGVAVLLLQVEGKQLGVSPQEPLPAQRTHRVPLWGRRGKIFDRMW